MSEQYFDCRRILVPLDGSLLAEAACPFAIGVAQLSGADILLARVVEWYWPPLAEEAGVEGGRSLEEAEEQICQQYLDGLVERYKDVGVKLSTGIARGDAASCLARLADTNNVDLIVMTTRGQGGFKRLALGSVADQLLHRAKQPIMLVSAAALQAQQGRLGRRLAGA
jgi:nucleotide-binding universal stress UspA family protein